MGFLYIYPNADFCDFQTRLGFFGRKKMRHVTRSGARSAAAAKGPLRGPPRPISPGFSPQPRVLAPGCIEQDEVYVHKNKLACCGLF